MLKDKNDREERRGRFARIWSRSRADAGKTQDYMAEGLGVSRKTIQNWESGVTAPDLFTGSEWFRVLGMNPLPYYLAYLYPDLFNEVDPTADEETVEEALMVRVHGLTPTEKRQLLFLMTGQHGSSWYSLLQMFTAHCHTVMQSRVNTARMIVENYEMDCGRKENICPESVQPDLKMLKNAIEECKKSVIRNASGYINIPSSQENERN